MYTTKIVPCKVKRERSFHKSLIVGGGRAIYTMNRRRIASVLSAPKRKIRFANAGDASPAFGFMKPDSTILELQPWPL